MWFLFFVYVGSALPNHIAQLDRARINNDQGKTISRRPSVDEAMSVWSEQRNCVEVDAGVRKFEREKLVVAMATDSSDLVPAFAVINSTLTHSRNASIVLFTTRKRGAVTALRRLRRQLASDARIRVCDGLDPLLENRPAIKALHALALRNPNATQQRIRRQELLSPYNFAAFYLPYCLRNTDEILYLDTDTVVRTDVFAKIPLLGGQRAKPIAAVEDCSQRLGKYINFPLLRKFLTKGMIGDLSAERFPVPIEEIQFRHDQIRAQHSNIDSTNSGEKFQRPSYQHVHQRPFLQHEQHNIQIKTRVQRGLIKRQQLSIMSDRLHQDFNSAVQSPRQGRRHYIGQQRMLSTTKEREKQPKRIHTSPSGKQLPVTEDTCVFNRGVVAVSGERWRDRKITETIEELIMLYVKSKARLWRGGVSQPPFLLALAGRYKKLPLEWNVRGLGRVDLGRTEMDALHKLVSWKRPHSNESLISLKRHVSTVAHFDKYSPFIAPLASRSAVLHYTGEVKPWRIARFAAARPDLYGISFTHQGHVDGHCRLSDLNTWRAKRADANATSVTAYFTSGCFAKLPLCACRHRPDCVEACASIWYRYVSEDARRVLFNTGVGSPIISSPPVEEDNLLDEQQMDDFVNRSSNALENASALPQERYRHRMLGVRRLLHSLISY